MRARAGPGKGTLSIICLSLSYDEALTEAGIPTNLIHNSRHVGFAFIMQISYTLLRGQTTKVQEVITNILATQMICFMFHVHEMFIT